MDNYCDSYIMIDERQLKENVLYYKKHSNKKLIAVIKNNAYGHGLIEISTIIASLVDAFAVANLNEAISLRNCGIKLPILVLNPINPNYLKLAISYDIMVTCSELNYLKEIEAMNIINNKKLKLQIKIDSGMNRFGLKTEEEYNQILKHINNSNKYDLVGIYTHFHTPQNSELSNRQINKFNEIILASSIDFSYIHTCSTNAFYNHLDLDNTTHVRIGLGLYGISDDNHIKQILSLYSQIAMVKKVKANEVVGYNAKYVANEDINIGILPIGYGDGILRANSGRFVFVDGYYCEIIGSICMNSLMIKLPNANFNKKEVEIIGPHIDIKGIAQYLNTIPYEVVTSLSKDIKRIII